MNFKQSLLKHIDKEGNTAINYAIKNSLPSMLINELIQNDNTKNERTKLAFRLFTK